MKYLKSLITVILLLISTICFADSAQKLVVYNIFRTLKTSRVF
jgi:hypothetical protein